MHHIHRQYQYIHKRQISQQVRETSDATAPTRTIILTGRKPFTLRLRIRILREIVIRFLILVQIVMVILHHGALPARRAAPIGFPEAFRRGVGAVEEVVIVHLSVGRERAFVAVLHIDEVDAVISFVISAPDVEKVLVVAHGGIWGTGDGCGKVRRIERDLLELVEGWRGMGGEC